jgi:hypothetical protein
MMVSAVRERRVRKENGKPRAGTGGGALELRAKIGELTMQIDALKKL